jgi:hypothetical protein
MQTADHANTYIVRRDEDRFSVVEIKKDKIDSYLHELKETMPQSSWRLEPRFPVNGAD